MLGLPIKDCLPKRAGVNKMIDEVVHESYKNWDIHTGIHKAKECLNNIRLKEGEIIFHIHPKYEACL
jgi:hypothetical protein